MVQKAKSGHPGMPMGMAPVAHVLWTRLMHYTPSSLQWWNRDRFLLSNGHGCCLQYVLLHLAGYNLSLDELKRFRQIDSKTPGHPEANHTDGVEVTTGPLGQGIANGVGLALAESHLAAVYNKDGLELFNNFTYVFAGDGCMQEGIASEAASLAGHWRLGRLIVVYDNNHVQIDGPTSLAFSEDVSARFRAYGWHVVEVEKGDSDLAGLEAALREAQAVTDRPSLVSVHTTIGFGSKKQGTEKVHGEALGDEDLKAAKTALGFKPDEFFVVPQSAYDVYHAAAARGAELEKQWSALWKQYQSRFPDLAAELQARFEHRLPAGWKDKLPSWKASDKPDATRNTSGLVLNAIADQFPAIVGGSADLTPSNKTELKKSSNYSSDNRTGRYIRFGVREHAMAAIGNGMAAYGGFIPYTATFLNFIEYAFPAVRLCAISNFQQLFIMTHDSIGLGEDGPTHQPIEALSLCRATPNLLVFRPADGNETTGSYIAAIEQQKGPSVFALTRQNLPQLERSSPAVVKKGGYTVYQSKEGEGAGAPELLLVASGSEVSLAIDTAKELQAELSVRVVSMPCDGLFDQQEAEYRRSVIPPGVPSISLECLSVQGWERYAHAHIGMTTYGASAPIEQVMDKFGFTKAKAASRIRVLLKEMKQTQSTCGLGVGLLPTHYQFSKTEVQQQHVH